MNARERYINTMSFKAVDRIPNYELGVWGQTYQRWLDEGAREEDIKGDWFRGEPKAAELDRREYIKLKFDPLPGLHKVIEETERYIVYIDNWGQTRRGLKEGEVRGTRMSMDTFMDFYVKTRVDFLEFKKHFDSKLPERYPADWEKKKIEWKKRDFPLYLCDNCGFAGLYWNLREMMGTERLSYAFYDQPELVHEILDFFVEYFMQVTEKALNEVEIDTFICNEDFACKSGPLLSPATYREFFLPRHKQMFNFVKSKGVKFIELDSDGNIEPLIPLIIEAGATCIWPLEGAAGMDPVKVRKEYGKDVALIGGIDKRKLFGNKRMIDEELEKKLLPLREEGGYIPTIDHTISPEVSYENFKYYIERKKKLLQTM